MSLEVLWLEEATEDLLTSARFYGAIRPELEQRFLWAVESAVERMAQGPLLCALVSKHARRIAVEKFPYGLFYLVEPERVVVIACFHAKRNSNTWHKRVT